MSNDSWDIYESTPKVNPSLSPLTCSHEPAFSADKTVRAMCMGITDKATCENKNFQVIAISKTWQESYEFTIALGGRIPSLSEERAIISKMGGGSLVTDDIWVPVGDLNNKDWMQIGDSS